LIVGAPLTLFCEWPEFLARYGFRRIGMAGGWERLGLESTIPLDSSEAALCDAVYVGDMITPEVRCPRCETPVWDVLRSS
jgi:hypothetical protein